jgi:hypothetical protein
MNEKLRTYLKTGNLPEIEEVLDLIQIHYECESRVKFIKINTNC